MKQLLPVLFAILCWTASFTPAVWSYYAANQVPITVQVKMNTSDEQIAMNSDGEYYANSLIGMKCSCNNESGHKWRLVEVVYRLNTVPLGKFVYGPSQEAIWYNSAQLDHNTELNVYPMSEEPDKGTSVWIQPLSSAAGTGNYSCIVWLGTGTKREAKFVSNLLPIVVKEEKEKDPYWWLG